MDTDYDCKGTTLQFSQFYFQLDMDASCAIDRGLTAGMLTGTGSSPLYDTTFGLCGHIDSTGLTQFGHRHMNEFSSCGAKRNKYWTRCNQNDWWQYMNIANWNTLSKDAFCGEQVSDANVPSTEVNEMLRNILQGDDTCRFFSAGGARLASNATGTWQSFMALAVEGDASADVVPKALFSCSSSELFFDSLASCELALLDPTSMTPSEIEARDTALDICLFDACTSRDVAVAVANTVTFRQTMYNTSWLVEEIIMVVAGVAVGIVALLVIGVVIYRRRMVQKHRKALLEFTTENAHENFAK